MRSSCYDPDIRAARNVFRVNRGCRIVTVHLQDYPTKSLASLAVILYRNFGMRWCSDWVFISFFGFSFQFLFSLCHCYGSHDWPLLCRSAHLVLVLSLSYYNHNIILIRLLQSIIVPLSPWPTLASIRRASSFSLSFCFHYSTTSLARQQWYRIRAKFEWDI